MNVVRIIPPLVTTADEVDQALAILDEALAAAGRLTADAAMSEGTDRRRPARIRATAAGRGLPPSAAGR